MSDTPTFLRSPRPTEQPWSFGQARSPRCKSVIFDMDGTITKPFFDFNHIRAEIGDDPDMIVSRLPDLIPPSTGSCNARGNEITYRLI